MSLLFKYGAALLKGATFLIVATVAWTAVGARIDRLEIQTAGLSQDVAAVKRETSSRFDDLNKQREQHARDIALLTQRMENMEKSLHRTEANTERLLERVGPPAHRR